MKFRQDKSLNQTKRNKRYKYETIQVKPIFQKLPTGAGHHSNITKDKDNTRKQENKIDKGKQTESQSIGLHSKRNLLR